MRFPLVFLYLSPAVLVISLTLSATVYYLQAPFIPSDLAVSTLQSPERNPAGYLIASAGPLVSALLLLPLVPFFLEKWRRSSPVFSLLGAGALFLSVAAFVLNAALSMTGYTGAGHSHLATVSFVFAVISVLGLLHAGKNHANNSSAESTRALPALIVLNYLAVALLLVLFVGPDYLGWPNPMRLMGISPFAIIGVSELVFLVLAFGSLGYLIKLAEGNDQASG